MLSCHYLISGKVQGVGFRAFSQKAARALSIKGWARNLKDGRVEIIATGDEQNIEDFEKILREGPTYGRVEKLEVEMIKRRIPEKETDFIILEDGD